MDATSGAAHTTSDKDEFFAADMYLFHITGFPQQPGVLPGHVAAPTEARLNVWRTDPADERHIPGPGGAEVMLSTPGFSLANSGNGTLHAPKRSWKVTLENAAHGDSHLAGMARVNLKSMYNDPSQMREALAWRLFRNAGVPSARHTYAKLAFDATYYGLFSVIEQIDKRFLKDHFGNNDRGNLYKAYCGDLGCATLEHRAAPGEVSGFNALLAAHHSSGRAARPGCCAMWPCWTASRRCWPPSARRCAGAVPGNSSWAGTMSSAPPGCAPWRAPSGCACCRPAGCRTWPRRRWRGCCAACPATTWPPAGSRWSRRRPSPTPPAARARCMPRAGSPRPG